MCEREEWTRSSESRILFLVPASSQSQSASLATNSQTPLFPSDEAPLLASDGPFQLPTTVTLCPTTSRRLPSSHVTF